MKGHTVIDVSEPATGNRKRHRDSFKGTKRHCRCSRIGRVLRLPPAVVAIGLVIGLSAADSADVASVEEIMPGCKNPLGQRP
jgi:hypothetical protein